MSFVKVSVGCATLLIAHARMNIDPAEFIEVTLFVSVSFAGKILCHKRCADGIYKNHKVGCSSGRN